MSSLVNKEVGRVRNVRQFEVVLQSLALLELMTGLVLLSQLHQSHAQTLWSHSVSTKGCQRDGFLP